MRLNGFQRAAVFASVLCMMMPIHAISEENDRLSKALSDISKQTVGSYGMTPIGASFVPDGDYSVEVESSSPYFDVASAVLHVKNSEMTLDFVIASNSYLRVFEGTAKSAKKADTFIEGTKMPDGSGTVFSVRVPALNQPFDCAAYSRRKKKWYSRKLLVNAASLPEGTLPFELPDYELLEDLVTQTGKGMTAQMKSDAVPAKKLLPCEVEAEDGEYSIEVNMTGGSGRASVSSPTLLIVEDGRAWTELTWSSSHYDYMIVNGERYDNLNTEGGNSLFRIPILNMDEPISVIADTTAMGDPIEIAYTLVFYEDTIGDKSMIPQVAAKKVLIVSAGLIAVGAVLNLMINKRKKKSK